MANRTKKGNPTAEARKKTGIKQTGKFPVFDEKSANSAIQLRNNGKGVSPEAVLNKVTNWAKKNNKKNVLAKVQKARKKQKSSNGGK